MIRHISIFTFRDAPDKQKNIETVKAYLETVPDLYPVMKAQFIGVPVAPTPDLPDDAPVMFGDLQLPARPTRRRAKEPNEHDVS